jgi:hypothetical protein
VGVRVKFESRNPPILLRHANSLSMSNFNAFINSLKKFQRWPHSQVICCPCLVLVQFPCKICIRYLENDNFEGARPIPTHHGQITSH